MITEIPSGQIATADVDYVTGAMPDGMLRPTGYYPNLPAGHIPEPITWDEPQGPGYDQVSNGVLDWTETIDQHPMLHVAATWTPAPEQDRPSGHHDPLTDGPPQPTLGDVSAYYTRSQGASSTEMLDRPWVKFQLNGVQDGVSWTYYQDPQLAMVPYDPNLQEFDPLAGVIVSGMPDTLRAMPPSPDHGWVQQPAMTPEVSAPFPEQQKAGRQERLANNPFAGQSYSAHTAHVGTQAGQVASMRQRV